jgi:stage V sporulation protein G
MTITDVRVHLTGGGTTLKASASVTLDEVFAVRDLKVIEGSKGLFVAMPSRKTEDGKYLDVAFPVTRDMRDQLQAKVLAEYEKALQKPH